MKQVFSILLILIILASHSYLLIGKHFCGGEAVESKILLGETHLDCGMMDMEEPCNDSKISHKNETCLDKSPCCQNEYQQLQMTEDFIQDSPPITLHIDFAIAFVYAIFNLDLYQNSTQSFFTEYNSPPIEKDIQVLFQTFLI